MADNGLVGLGLLCMPIARESVAEEEYFDIVGKMVVVVLAEQNSNYPLIIRKLTLPFSL